ncbi:ABC transporter permease [Actinacidiphila oryziradicis]|uniref:ABC transporter permease n=1 Tax=Actinacidiphila oryziradicis TaxID=2571141 RepID=UPI003211D9BE
MTAPLTPHEQPSTPSYPSASGLPTEGLTEQERMEFGPELKRGALTALVVAVCGVVLGLLWLWLAPRIPLVSDGKAVYLKDSEGEQAVGADGTFVLLGLGMGALTALVALWRCRRGGIGIVLGLAVGGVLGSLLAWRIGVWLGPTQDIVAHAKQVGAKKVFDGPLDLQAKAALLVWPIAATLAHLGLTTAFGPRDPQPPQGWDVPLPPPPQ